VLKECDVLGAGRLLRLSWDESWHLMERAVTRGLKAKPARVIEKIGVDEKAVAAGQTYITVVCDLEAGTVEHIADERKQSSLDSYFDQLTADQLAGIQAVAMDMWDPFVNSVLARLQDAQSKIVFDRYHLMSHMVKAVDTVRKRENRVLLQRGDQSLVGSKYLWLFSAENLPQRHQQRFEILRAIDLKTSRAWAIKENLRLLWEYSSPYWAARWWQRWYFWATHSRLQPVIDVARMFKRRQQGIMTFFRHRVTNAAAEGLNSRIQAIRVMARGYRNREHFKTAIYFHLGGLSLYPATHSIAG